MSGNSLEACIEAWRSRRPLKINGNDEDLADRQFALGAFKAAAEGYAACTSQTDQVKAKRGWCLAALEQFDEAEQFLTPTTCGTSSAELAMLAVVVAGGWNRSKLQGGSGTKGDEVKARSEQVAELVSRALEVQDEPDYLAFLAYKALAEWYRDRDAALVVCERAVKLFKSPTLILWHALLLRTLGRPTDAALDALLAQMPEDPSLYVCETLQSALALSRYDDALAALEVFDSKLRPEQDSSFLIGLTLMRSYIELRRALDADPGTAARALTAVQNVVSDLREGSLPAASDGGLWMFALKVRLALGVVVKDEVVIRESAKAVIDSSWSADYAPDYSPGCELLWLGGLHHEADFGRGYLDPAVIASLSPEDQIDWRLLIALQTSENESDTEFIAVHGAARAPAWAAATVILVLLDSKTRNPYEAGRVLARQCLHLERIEKQSFRPPGFDYDDLSAAQLSQLVDGIVKEVSSLPANETGGESLLVNELASVLYAKKALQDLKRLTDLILVTAPDETDALFYGALARQELRQWSEAMPLYERLLALDADHRSAYWNVTLIYEAQGNPRAIEEMLPALEERAGGGDEKWIKARDLARAAAKRARLQQAKTDFQALVHRQLAAYPALRETPIEANELSLLEAASLIALLRASDIDHAAWTLGAFESSSIPFEPTDRFRPVLFDLVRKGVIRIGESSPADAFSARDGELYYYLGRVQWSISPYTLALQSHIRDMARQYWPEKWLAHVEVLSRDLATEECVAYMEHLAEERGLDPPDRTDARALFRELLEQCCVGKCWYYIYSGVQSANDYRTKYSVSRAQVTAMMLKRTRERGEIAIAKGWGTQYSRIRALPRSHLSAALHDVLTGWGERAFEEPIRILAVQ